MEYLILGGRVGDKMADDGLRPFEWLRRFYGYAVSVPSAFNFVEGFAVLATLFLV